MRWALALTLAAGCGQPPAPVIAHHAPPSPAPDPCPGRREQLILTKDHPATTSDGLAIVYRGDMEDLLTDGSSLLALVLDVGGEPWRPDIRDRGFAKFGSHCVRVVDDSAGLKVEVSGVAAMRCEFACCVTPEQRKPAPDGSTECCICQ